MHRIGGLEKSNETGAISTEPENHNKMVHLRQAKVDKIANYIPELEVLGDKDADLLIVGWVVLTAISVWLWTICANMERKWLSPTSNTSTRYRRTRLTYYVNIKDRGS